MYKISGNLHIYYQDDEPHGHIGETIINLAGTIDGDFVRGQRKIWENLTPNPWASIGECIPGPLGGSNDSISWLGIDLVKHFVKEDNQPGIRIYRKPYKLNSYPGSTPPTEGGTGGGEESASAAPTASQINPHVSSSPLSSGHEHESGVESVSPHQNVSPSAGASAAKDHHKGGEAAMEM